MGLCLIVDDSKIVRNICCDIVRELGFEAAEAENGQEALEFCTTQIPLFILLDWNMPVMDGMDFLKTFRTLDNNEATKVIVCTTENDLKKIQEAISSGADEYIMKPFDGDIVKGKLQQLGLL